MSKPTQKIVTVTAVAADLYDAIPSPAGIVIKNVGAVTMYLGDSTVTTADGFPLDPGDVYSNTRRGLSELYAVTAAVAADAAILYDTGDV